MIEISDITKPDRAIWEQRSWGKYTVVDLQRFKDGTEMLVKRIEMLPRSNISYQKHEKRSEVWTIVEGSGKLALGNKIMDIFPGDIIRINRGQWHSIRANLEGLFFVEVQRGSELAEEDITRRYTAWEDIVTHVEFEGMKVVQ